MNLTHSPNLLYLGPVVVLRKQTVYVLYGFVCRRNSTLFGQPAYWSTNCVNKLIVFNISSCKVPFALFNVWGVLVSLPSLSVIRPLSLWLYTNYLVSAFAKRVFAKAHFEVQCNHWGRDLTLKFFPRHSICIQPEIARTGTTQTQFHTTNAFTCWTIVCSTLIF